MPERIKKLTNWLNTQLNSVFELTPITNDASFRRYFRVDTNGEHYIAMDAPPDKENCHPYVNVANQFVTAGLNAPKVIASDFSQGFLLITDLGSQLYLPALNSSTVEKLYKDAFDALLIMQTLSAGHLPAYDEALLQREMNLFIDWLLEKYLNYPLSTDLRNQLQICFNILIDNALSQPQIFVHRDYHSRNLIVTTENNPGILDFQDAVKGPITYDLVSLLRDCYIAWPQSQIETWVKHYYQRTLNVENMTEETFLRWFNLMGIQRHLKASGIFARLYCRDQKNGYLKDVPRTLNYIVTVSEHYPELKLLHDLIAQEILPQFFKHTTKILATIKA